MKSSKIRKVVLAYSGGLDTSVILKWLQDKYDCEVVTFTADIGQGEELEPAREKAKKMGVKSIFVEDLREEFVRDFVFPMFRANAVYEGEYLLGTSIARPLIAKNLVQIAKQTGADAISHGATGKGNDQVRFDVAVHALDPGLEVVAPMRVGMGLTRDQEIDYAIERGIEIPVTKASSYSIDVNLWGRSCETGVLEDPWVTPPADAYEWTIEPIDAPGPVEITIEFEGGVPVALDGERLPPVDLVDRISKLSGQHGVGRIDHVEDRLVGIKSREIYEAPAALVLIEAHRALEDLVLTRAELDTKRILEDRWATLVYEGLWFSPARQAIDAFVEVTQAVVAGEVRLELRAAAAAVSGRRSPNALYAETLASYGEGETFPHAAAEGFVQIAALETELAAARERKNAAV